MSQASDRKERIKFILDVLEDIMTIVVSLGAIWGTVLAFESGFVHKVSRLVDHYHSNLVKIEENIKQDKILSIVSDLEGKSDTEQKELSDIQKQEKKWNNTDRVKEKAPALPNKEVAPHSFDKRIAPDINPSISNTAQK